MTDEQPSDPALMTRFARGQQSAFEMLYHRHEARVWRYLFRQCGNRAVAEELMQEVWFAVARDAGKYQPSARFTTWLLTIAHNRMIDHVRARRPHLSLVDTAEPAAPAHEQPLAAALAHDEMNAVAGALARLPREQREVILLQLDGELSVEDIAAITATTFETVKSRLRYARDKLRVLLKEYA